MIVFLGKAVAKIKPFELALTTDGKDYSNFGTRPVFLITFTDGTKLVLKAEMADDGKPKSAQKSSVFIAGLHSGMTSGLGVLGVDKADMESLAEAQEGLYDFSAPAVARKYLRVIVLEAKGFFEWYTMNFFDALKSLEKQAEKNKDQQNMAKVGAYKLACKMKNDPNLLHGLGMIVAVDLFSGNLDRFDGTGHIVNKGNIVFQKNADKTYSPLGVDFFDAKEAAANLYNHVNNPTTWIGMVLVDPQKIRAFAVKAVGELNQMFAGAIAPRAMPPEAVLVQAEVNAFAAAIQAGSDHLRTDLQIKVRKGFKLPSGVDQRMQLLGWNAINFNGWMPALKPQATTPQNLLASSSATPLFSPRTSPGAPPPSPNTSPVVSPNTSPVRQRRGPGYQPPQWINK